MTSRFEYVQAGYHVDQIVSCCAGDPCPCEYFIAGGNGYSPVCGLGPDTERAKLSKAMRTMMPGTLHGD